MFAVGENKRRKIKFEYFGSTINSGGKKTLTLPFQHMV